MAEEKRAELLDKIKKLKELMEDIDDIDVGRLRRASERVEDFMDDNGISVTLEECPFYSETGSEHHEIAIMDLIFPKSQETCPFCKTDIYLP
nr:hypothetical protein [Candidatus Sigynarchaeota archaeon]